MDQAENLRKIMQQKEEQAKEAARVIAVTSGKGGVGKSSVSVNLAIQFARMGKSVVILDADFGLANVEVMFGVIPKYNLSDLLYNGRELKEIICEGPEGIQFISGGSGIANLANFDKEQVKRLIYKMTELEKIADIVIIDTGAGINPSVMEFLISSPETILVTTPEPTSVTDSYALLKALIMTEGFQGKNTTVKMIANRVSDAGEGKNLYEKLSMVVSNFLNINIEFLGVIPQDSYITKAIMKQKPVSIMYPNAAASKQFEAIAKKLSGTQQDVPDSRRGIRGYFKNFFAKKNVLKELINMSKKILIIDDSALMRRVISDIIKLGNEYEVAAIAKDGLEGYEYIRQNPTLYSAVILDINMPKMNGLELLQKLQKNHIEQTVIVVSTVAKEGAKETIQALEYGAFDFVTKPENYFETKGNDF